MSRTLVEELRYWEGEYHYPSGLLTNAADKIDTTEAALTTLHTRMKQLADRWNSQCNAVSPWQIDECAKELRALLAA